MTAPGGLTDSVGKVVGSIIDDFKPELEAAAGALIGPNGLLTAVGKLIGALWGDGDGALAGAFKLLGKAIEAAFALAKPFFDALTWLVNNIASVIDALNKSSGAPAVSARTAAQNAAAGSTAFGLGASTGGGSTTVMTNIMLDKKVVGQAAASYLGLLDPNPRRTYP
jgi:hypothetical protein